MSECTIEEFFDRRDLWSASAIMLRGFFSGPTDRTENQPSTFISRERRADKRSYWLHETYLILEATFPSAQCARFHTRQVLREWGWRDASDTVELLVSELVTNAIRASHAAACGRPIRFWLLADDGCLRVAVWDDVLTAPVRREVHADDEGGRGLLLVETVSDRWSWYYPPRVGGKVVWAEITR